MAITKCKECSNAISTKAKVCPHCGARPSTSSKRILIAVALFLPGLAVVVADLPDPQITPPPLELTSLECIPGDAMLIANGSVKNVSGKRIDGVTAEISFYAEDGAFVQNESTLINYQPIMPGQQSTFWMMRKSNPAIKQCKVKFTSGFSPVAHVTK